MTLDRVRAEVSGIANDLGLRGARTEVEQSGRWLHILISSEDFRGRSAGERDNVVWREFERRFDDETLLAITQCYLVTPEEQGALAGSPA